MGLIEAESRIVVTGAEWWGKWGDVDQKAHSFSYAE